MWDEANLGLEATVLLSAADPEIAELGGHVAGDFVRIGAGSLAALLDTTGRARPGPRAPPASADAADAAEGARR